MIIVESIMLTCMLFFGGYFAYTDLKKGIVPNKYILIGLIVGLALNCVYLLFGTAEFYLYWLLNMFVADIIAFGMYMGKMWAAGDAKLFMLLFILVPARLLDSDTLSHSVVAYIFIFVPALLWMLSDSLVRIIKREDRKREHFSFKDFLSGFAFVIIETTAFHALLSWLFPRIIDQQALFFSAIVLVYAYLCGTLPLMRKWYIVIGHVIVIIVLWLCNKWMFVLPSWETYLILGLVFIIQRLCSLYNYQLIATDQAKAGMIPAAETIIAFQTSKVHSLPTDPSEELTARISEEEAAAIRRWEKSVQGKPNIWIVRKVPFAIMICIGFIVWMLFRILWR